jgi:hypothetical protein
MADAPDPAGRQKAALLKHIQALAGELPDLVDLVRHDKQLRDAWTLSLAQADFASATDSVPLQWLVRTARAFMGALCDIGDFDGETPNVYAEIRVAPLALATALALRLAEQDPSPPKRDQVAVLRRHFDAWINRWGWRTVVGPNGPATIRTRLIEFRNSFVVTAVRLANAAIKWKLNQNDDRVIAEVWWALSAARLRVLALGQGRPTIVDEERARWLDAVGHIEAGLLSPAEPPTPDSTAGPPDSGPMVLEHRDETPRPPSNESEALSTTERIRRYLQENPDANSRAVGKALGKSAHTVRNNPAWGEHQEARSASKNYTGRKPLGLTPEMLAARPSGEPDPAKVVEAAELAGLLEPDFLKSLTKEERAQYHSRPPAEQIDLVQRWIEKKRDELPNRVP